ncbi:hypothetical protein QM012_001121 [Aureobasidium pullulans]|uniref:Secreted protein n=1 Tax=Aureobasidium pullulans TaxID=5580 RepID=A0ABR0TH92_AURPU
MQISATLLTLCLGMHMPAAAPINSTTTGITVDSAHSTDLSNATVVDKRDGINWEWWCDWWWEPICGGQPGPTALNAPIDPTTGEIINATAVKEFAERSNATPVKRHTPSWWKNDPCCTFVFCHRKPECDIDPNDVGKYNQRCGWC